MDATQFVIILGALGTFITVLAAGFVTVYKAVSTNGKKTDQIHILVNGNLTAAREDLAAFRTYADGLVAQ